MSGQELVLLVYALVLLAGGDAPVTVTKPATPPAPGTRHYLVQVRILDIDEQGRAAVIASPTVQTTGSAAGVTIDGDRGRRFEFHFSATEAGAPSPLPVILGDDNIVPKPIAVTSSTTLASDRVLEKRVSIKALRQPRKDVLGEVTRQAGLRLVLEPESAAAAVEPLAAPVSCQFENAPLDQVLKQLVEPTRLGYAVESGFVVLGVDVPPTDVRPAAPAPSEEGLQVRVYDVSDLVTKDAASGKPDFQPILTRLQAGVLPKSWDASGGMATVRGFDSTISLVIRQTPAGHDAIAKFLDELSAKKP
ncbi:MAG TPA: hypothetical protein VM165_05230 [Planctomycetaceae bacterium]|nr:hypothetical protein [Planctomycetaceae bacterium]